MLVNGNDDSSLLVSVICFPSSSICPRVGFSLDALPGSWLSLGSMSISVSWLDWFFLRTIEGREQLDFRSFGFWWLDCSGIPERPYKFSSVAVFSWVSHDLFIVCGSPLWSRWSLMWWLILGECLLFDMAGFGFKGERVCAKIWLGVAWLFTVGERWPALHSDVLPSVGVVTWRACVLFRDTPEVV